MRRVALALRTLALSAVALLALAAVAGAGEPAGGGRRASPGLSAEPVLREAERANEEAAGAQVRVDRLSDEVDELASRYRQALAEADALERYDAELEALIGSQRKEIESLRRQIEGVTETSREVLPLLERMMEALARLVGLDIPFLPEERAARIERLRAMMRRADVSVAEKFRRLIEALRIEGEYGRTIEAYRGGLSIDGERRTVDFLRIGRLALLYQTLDGSRRGVWDAKARRWVELDPSYRSSIRRAIRVARERAAPELLRVPVPAPAPASAGRSRPASDASPAGTGEP